MILLLLRLNIVIRPKKKPTKFQILRKIIHFIDHKYERIYVFQSLANACYVALA